MCKGEHKRKEFMKAVSKENIEKITKYFKKFWEWVAEWQREFPDIV